MEDQSLIRSVARLPSTCPNCKQKIQPGTQIVKITEGPHYGRWSHYGCQAVDADPHTNDQYVKPDRLNTITDGIYSAPTEGFGLVEIRVMTKEETNRVMLAYRYVGGGSTRFIPCGYVTGLGITWYATFTGPDTFALKNSIWSVIQDWQQQQQGTPTEQLPLW